MGFAHVFDGLSKKHKYGMIYMIGKIAVNTANITHDVNDPSLADFLGVAVGHKLLLLRRSLTVSNS